MRERRGQRRRGVTVIELLTVVVVTSMLMAMGFLLFRSMRRAARVATAEARLKQVSAGLELYFRDRHGYPPEGCDLTVELRPYIKDPAVFDNPLNDGDEPGDDLNDFYREPSLGDIDRPGTYVVCFPPGSTGDPVIVLETGDRITRRGIPGGDVDSFQRDSLITFLYQGHDVVGGDGDEPTDSGDDGGTVLPPPPPDDSAPDAHPDYFTDEPTEGTVVPQGCCDVTVSVVAADLTWGPDGPAVPIQVALVLNDDEGPTTTALYGGQEVQGGESEATVLRKGQAFTLEVHAEYGLWAADVASDDGSGHVLTLRNGDQPEQFDPHVGSVPIGGALNGLIDPATGTVTIDDRQVLYLVELGSTSPVSLQFDYQDLIVLTAVSEPSNPAECETTPLKDSGFDITDGEVVVRLCSDVTIRCIGSQFGYADGALVPIATAAKIGADEWFSLFEGNAVCGGEEYACPSAPAGSVVTLKGSIIGDYEIWLWNQYGYPTSYTSGQGSEQVLIYQSGDAPPDFAPGFPCQTAVGDLVADYIDPQTGVVTICTNEALYLWDFNPVWTGYGIDYQDLIILATAIVAEYECEKELEATDTAAPTMVGTININPNNTDKFEFHLETPEGPITRDDLHADDGVLDYTGTATSIIVRPKGNGNQNGLVVDGEPYPLRNGRNYVISGGTINVHLYNDNWSNGSALGKWWIDITATGATIERHF